MANTHSTQVLTVQQLETHIQTGQPIHLIDVRSRDEYDSGHVPKAINIPLEQLEARLHDLPNGEVAILCQSGGRARIACELLTQQRPGVFLVEGGTSAWVREGRPVIQTSKTKWALERQVRLVAGLLALVGSVLAVTINPSWVYLPMFIGAGLTFAGATNICGMAMMLAKLPWNKSQASCAPATKVQA